MKLQRITKNDIITIYNDYMILDFPQEELKPLAVILDLLDKDTYFAYGLYHDSKLLAYMFLCKNGDYTLLDYFAVLPAYRCHGYGSKCLELLFEKSNETGILLLEVEDPAFSCDSKDETIRKRRIQFYIHSGIIMSEIKVLLFGTHMNILYKPYHSIPCSEHQLQSALIDIYQVMFTPEQLKTKVLIKK